MINIRNCISEDYINVIESKVDAFIGDRDFFDIPNDELVSKKQEIEEYVKKNFDNMKVIISEGNVIGSFAIYDYKDGAMFDSVSIIEKYNNDEVKNFVIKYVKSSNRGIIYTTIYERDLELYKSYGFEEIEHNSGQYKLKLIEK